MRDRKWKPGTKPEFEVAWYTKELGKPLQRQMLQQQLARLTEDRAARQAGNEAGEGKAGAPKPAGPQPKDRKD